MDTSKLNLSSLREKITSKLGSNTSKGPNNNKKDTNEKKSQKDKSQKDKSQNKKQSEPTDDEILRREALSLGATEEDLQLIKGMTDSNEVQESLEGDSKLDKGFSSDLSKFMKGIGLDNQEAIVVDDNDVSDFEGSDNEGDQEGDQNGSSEIEQDDNDQAEEVTPKSNSDSNSDSDSDSDSNSNSASEDSEENPEETKLKQVEMPNGNTKIRFTDDKEESGEITDFKVVNSSKLAIPSRFDWFNTPLEIIETSESLDGFAIKRLYEKAEKIVTDDNNLYLQEFSSNSSQKKFLSQILSSGTLNDKISALTLLIQEDPLHNIKAFETLLGFCEKKSRTASLQAINSLKDLLINGLLPDRKLMSFNKRPLKKDLSDLHLAIYYYEDFLKKSYFKLIQVLESLCHDPIVHVKMNVVTHIFDFLRSKPEQEENLLRLGVNKLGDNDNKIAGKTSYQILQLEQAHPAMKKIIIDAVIDTMLKPNVHHNGQYYSILTLNQTILTRNETQVANVLINTYFSLFQKILVETDDNNAEKTGDNVMGKSEKGRKNNRKNFKKGKKGGKSVVQQKKTDSEVIEEKSSKLFSALLTGLNRAFPFSDLPSDVYQKHMETLFRITHSSNFNTSVQALVLINHILTKLGLNTDRYYRTLYESLLDPRLLHSSKQGIYLNLLFKSLKSDSKNHRRVMAFVKRILQISSNWLNIGTITGMLYLLIELSKEIPQVQDLMIDLNSRPDEENQEETDNEEYDSRKRDPNYANAHKSLLWEVSNFINHYHPTVSIYAQSLLEGQSQDKPDLGLYTLSHFLDRFVYRNAKNKPTTKGSSIMQPLGGAHTGSLLVRSTNVSDNSVPVNTEDWLSKKSQDIRPDEAFFHQYFTTKASKIKSADSKSGQNGEDDEDDLDDNEVWDALVKSRPEVEDDSDDDSVGFDEEDFSEMSESDDGGDEDGDDDVDDDGSDQQFDQESENFGQDDNESIAEGLSDASDASDNADEQESGDEDDKQQSIFGISNDDEYDSNDEEQNIQMLDFDEPKDKKRGRKDEGDDKSKKSKRKKLHDLPVFASADDYSQYLNSEDES